VNSSVSAKMKVILFGATGMVGQGVLRECLLDPDVERVVAVGRSPAGQAHAKLREIMHDNFLDFSAIESQLAGYDACFFCLGVSSIGMDEQRYRHLTYDITMAAATTLSRLNPGMTFIYVTGRGTDSTEQGSRMWTGVKGKTENDLLKLPFKAAYMFRPAGHIVRQKITRRKPSTWSVDDLFSATSSRLYPPKEMGSPSLLMGRAFQMRKCRASPPGRISLRQLFLCRRPPPKRITKCASSRLRGKCSSPGIRHSEAARHGFAQAEDRRCKAWSSRNAVLGSSTST
jgi:hypothetical protein